jgi:hypothetical protein
MILYARYAPHLLTVLLLVLHLGPLMLVLNPLLVISTVVGVPFVTILLGI